MAGRIRAMLVASTVIASSVAAQKPLEFKANMRLQSGTDGTTSTGIVYFGGTKMRTEMTMDGQSVIILMDHAAKSQVMLMPSEKVYMPLPAGQGPVNIPVTGPTDPTNPCAAGSGATDCVKGPNESVNGYDAVRWDYTNQEGTRTRAWVSPKLRFAVKTEDDNGTKVEFSNIAEGPQAASLFAIPSGYTKMDMGGMGGMGSGRGRGRAGRGNADPIAAAMAGLSPEDAAAFSKAMRGAGAGSVAPPRGPAGPTGSAWEKGKGWILSFTVTGGTSDKQEGPDQTVQRSYSMKAAGSLPLNFVSPAAGVPGAPGPVWTLLAGDGVGIPQANAVPLALSAQTESKLVRSWKARCTNDGFGQDPGTSVETMKSTFQKSIPLLPPGVELTGMGNLTLSGDLKTYNLVFGLGGHAATAKEVTQIHTETKLCTTGAPHTEDKSNTRDGDYSIQAFDLKGLPLPASVSPITGTKKLPVRFDGREFEATLTWTLTPIR